MRTRQTGEDENKNAFFRLAVFQFIICAVVFGLIFSAMKLNPSLFESFRNGFNELMSKNYEPDFPEVFPQSENGTVSGNKKLDDAGETGNAEEASADEEENTEGSSAAGGEDISSDVIKSLVSFDVYSAVDTPVMPVAGSVTSGFGERVHPVYGTRGFHSGRDIAADEGAPVYAVLDGEVVAVGVGEKSGNYVKLSHGDSLETLYCHCSRINAEEGITVRKGDVIAFVGQTGLATGPHLHFEVHINGSVCDPEYLLKDACVVS